MEPDEYFKRINEEIRNSFATFLERDVAQVAFAFIDQRVRQKGEKASGGSFSPYSTTPIFIGRKSFTSDKASNKVLGSKQKRKELPWRRVRGHNLAILEGGYRQIRILEGRQVNHKDFERTGEMWKSIRTLGVKEEERGVFVLTLGSDNQLSQMKMQNVKDREGVHLLELSDREEGALIRMISDWMIELLNKVAGV